MSHVQFPLILHFLAHFNAGTKFYFKHLLNVLGIGGFLTKLIKKNDPVNFLSAAAANKN